jgi:hypothetical protein
MQDQWFHQPFLDGWSSPRMVISKTNDIPFNLYRKERQEEEQLLHLPNASIVLLYSFYPYTIHVASQFTLWFILP